MGSLSVWHWVALVVTVYVLVFWRQKAPAAATANDGLGQPWALGVPRGDADTYSRAERLRDEIENRFRRALQAPGVSLTCYRSVRGNAEVWLRMEFAKGDPSAPELSVRTVIAVTIERHDFHRFEHVARLEVGRGSFRRRVQGLTELTDADITELVAFAAGTRLVFPRLRSQRLREAALQFWRPRNRVDRLRRDWLGQGLLAAGLLGLLAGGAGVWLVSEVGIGCDELGECTGGAWAFPLLLAGAALLGVRHIVLRRRLTLVLNTGKPTADPQTLVRMDSWQATLAGIGARAPLVLKQVVERLERSRPAGVTVRAETIGYASVDAKVEREQWVVAFRRAVAFVRLECYGNDLYVGWDSHVNAGVWREQGIASGIDRRSGAPVEARQVVQGWQQPSEYDLSDASFLAEWLHAAVVAVVKQQIAEQHIDQEIDFTIQRESRAGALNARQPGAAARHGGGGFGLLKRKA